VRNAHLRFGHLIYSRAQKKSTTRFRVPLDRFIGERESDSVVKAHLISVVGGDTQVAAIAAAVSSCDSFMIESPDYPPLRAGLGGKAQCYRGSLVLKDFKRPLRHLIAMSEELTRPAAAAETERAILFDDSAHFVWSALTQLYGLPAVPDWADWMLSELTRLNAVEPLIGVGCNPVLIKGPKGLFMNCISRGVREGLLRFPETNGSVEWRIESLSHRLLVGS
jgi:hypothetical protein